ncbi:MAG: hypothetical protein LBV76_05115, partial [Deltaproteobacteria bacterium]|nr:hypothetical protein [Deltaproteobacteria bacterium]
MSALFRINPISSATSTTSTDKCVAQTGSVAVSEAVCLLKAEEWAVFCGAEDLLKKAGEEAEQ